MPNMVLVIDNYDSFTYNLVQLVGRITPDCRVFRNDKITLEEIGDLAPRRILISPGPGWPKDAGITKSVIEKFGPSVPIFGVCLGHQAMAEVYGSELMHAPELLHGKTSLISHDGKGVFKNLPQNFEATRYHSIAVNEKTVGSDLEITAHSDDGIIQGLRHKQFPVEGVQFHPESILTKTGYQIIKNWIDDDE